MQGEDHGGSETGSYILFYDIYIDKSLDFEMEGISWQFFACVIHVE